MRQHVLKNQLSRYTMADGGPFGAATMNHVELARDTLSELGQLSRKLPADRYFTDQFIGPANAFDHAAVLAMPAKL